ncbi:MAG: acyltransferase family protein, partial [Myxococcota bacterium]|nr:acyltransferase family protein [Myxococcota bacterium]
MDTLKVKQSYRPDIDGLRAIAVLAVVLSHAEAPGFSGGFVGVDVFFVISGFLITGIIVDQLRAQTFRFRDFWMRRVRRLAPALLAVISTATLTFALLLEPELLREFGRSLVAQTLLVSNVFFWKQSGYFDTAAHFKPLLHTWSLAVEEQFYILLPPLLWLLNRRSKKLLMPALVLGTASSFALCIWATNTFSSAAFYLLPFRAWEMGIGSCLALYLRTGKPARWEVSGTVLNAVSAAGLVAIAAAILAYDRYTPFPSYWAAFPTVGTAAILWAHSARTTAVGQLLSLGPIVYIGKISYSLYLWHWVVFTFVRTIVVGPPGPEAMAAATVFSIVLASISYHLIEQPFRRNRLRYRDRSLLIATAACALCVIASGAVIEKSKGWPERLQVAEDEFDRPSRRRECFLTQPGDPIFCRLGEAHEPALLVMGDSHSHALLDGFEVLAEKHSVGGYFAAGRGCLPFWGAESVRASEDVARCAQILEKAKELVSQGDIQHIVLAARWSLYLTSTSPDGEHQAIVSSSNDSPGVENSARVFRQALDTTVARLSAEGVRISVVEQVPHQWIEPRQAIFRAHNLKLDPNRFSVSVSAHQRLQEPVRAEFDRHDEIQLINLDDIYCTDRCWIFDAGGRSLYSDGDHLNARGSLFAEPGLRPIFEALASRPAPE